MAKRSIKKIVIIGGGTAGWISAAALAQFLDGTVSITLIESDAIGTVGVGEATIPQIRRLNSVLGLDENEVVRETGGTFKLGIEFSNWGHVGERYLHTFGDAGINLSALHFHHYWRRARAEGSSHSYWDYSLHQQAAYANRFGRLERVGNTPMTGLAYAFHFDAGLYARYLRGYAEAKSVERREGRIVDTHLDGHSGFIRSVQLENGDMVEGDFFIDCSGFRGLLIGQALGVEYEDWSKWLPCNRAIAIPSEKTTPPLPYTKAIAHDAGWQWRIPLQHRTGNGHVFCDSFTDAQSAHQTLIENLDGTPLADPNNLRFTTGRRRQFWHKNCVAIGLASGFLEPLESTSIHLIQSNISRFIEMFPSCASETAVREEYNRQVSHEYELIRDFLILHYHRTDREDSAFWRYCKNMDVPESVTQKMALFTQSGRLYKDADDLFRESSWVQVMLGQGLMPEHYHAMADRISSSRLNEFMGHVETIVTKAVADLPEHQDFIDAHCKSALQ